MPPLPPPSPASYASDIYIRTYIHVCVRVCVRARGQHVNVMHVLKCYAETNNLFVIYAVPKVPITFLFNSLPLLNDTVCMYVCIDVCMYVCMHAYMYV